MGMGLCVRNVFIGFLFLVAIWIGWGAPVPWLGITPMAPDPGLPTFQPVVEGEAGARRVPEREPPAEDPVLRRLDDRVVSAAHRLEAFPCDPAARRELRAAVSAMVKENLRRVRSGEAEKAEREGRRRARPASLDDDAIDVIITDAVHQRVLQPEDLGIFSLVKPPFEPPSGFDTKGRFVCEEHTQRR